MLRYSNELNGFLDDVNTSDITSPKNQLRSSLGNLAELAESIDKVGLLQPIIVRANSSEKFEIVAGNRRFNACKKLRKRKIACHIVELDDKEAFEASIIENVQRQTLNPIEESLAFKKYVEDYGWGGVSDLSHKLSKSTSYVSKRLKLLQLPKDIMDLISKSEINVSIAEELLQITDKPSLSKLTELTRSENLSSKMVRKIVKGMRSGSPDNEYIQFPSHQNEYERIHRLFDKTIIVLRISIKKLATIIENIKDNWILYEVLMQVKHKMHQQIEYLIKQKRKYKKHALHRLCIP